MTSAPCDDRVTRLFGVKASMALGGQVAGRIEDIAPVAVVVGELVEEFHATVVRLARYQEG